MEITERIENSFQNTKINTGGKTISGVAILNRTSQKGLREYSPGAMLDVATAINGAKCYINHATGKETQGVRDLRDLVGTFSGGRLDNGTVKADFHYLENHALMVEALAGMPNIAGFSIHAIGETHTDKTSKIMIIDSIKQFNSADLVSAPGSTIGIYESGDITASIHQTAANRGKLSASEADEIAQDFDDLMDLIKPDVKQNADDLARQFDGLF